MKGTVHFTIRIDAEDSESLSMLRAVLDRSGIDHKAIFNRFEYRFVIDEQDSASELLEYLREGADAHEKEIADFMRRAALERNEKNDKPAGAKH